MVLGSNLIMAYFASRVIGRLTTRYSLQVVRSLDTRALIGFPAEWPDDYPEVFPGQSPGQLPSQPSGRTTYLEHSLGQSSGHLPAVIGRLPEPPRESRPITFLLIAPPGYPDSHRHPYSFSPILPADACKPAANCTFPATPTTG